MCLSIPLILKWLQIVYGVFFHELWSAAEGRKKRSFFDQIRMDMMTPRYVRGRLRGAVKCASA
jgi:hypothetical protein